MRKHYLDNIRFMTIILVVVFHVFFYYNNIGIAAMFPGAPEYQGNLTFAGIFQYFVYPWFMVLLFVVSGISAKIALGQKSDREFFKARVDKILAPSTLGVLAFGWIGGYAIYLQSAKATLPEGTPGFVGAIISLCCGIGALWFCHVLFVAVLLLLLIRKITGKSSRQKSGERINQESVNQKSAASEPAVSKLVTALEHPAGFILALVLMFLLLWGGSHILNMPLITAYRLGIYIPAFFLGYCIFSEEKVMEKLEKWWFLSGAASVAAGIFYISRCYGQAYGDIEVLKRFDLNLYAFLMVLFILGAAKKFLNFTNGFFSYMKRSCFGIYVLHIPILLVTNSLLTGTGMPVAGKYLIEAVVAFPVSLLLHELIRRIPVLRYWILGIRKKSWKSLQKSV